MSAPTTPHTSRENKFSPRPVLRTQIKEYIVQMILNRELQPGERVVESVLARKLGVSQAPVREAIRDLELTGFLVTEPFRGATVRLFTPEELEEVYSVRAALESLAGEQAAKHITAEHEAELRRILDEMMAAARAGDMILTSKLNNQFHEMIWRISGNKFLHKFWESLQLAQWTVITSSRSKKSLVELVERHEEILEALKSRDPQRASQAMRAHIERLEKPVNGGGGKTE